MSKVTVGPEIVTSLLLFSIVFVTSCTNQSMERRINALERRVQALEGNKSSNPLTNTIKLASEPEKIENVKKVSKIDFEEVEYEFGTISEGDVINHTFTFKNTGNVPLIIEKASASCGCTVPKWPKKPIPAGSTGEIDVRFDSKNKPNRQIKTITITSNTDPVLTRLKIVGFVTPMSELAGPVKN